MSPYNLNRALVIVALAAVTVLFALRILELIPREWMAILPFAMLFAGAVSLQIRCPHCSSPVSFRRVRIFGSERLVYGLRWSDHNCAVCGADLTVNNQGYNLPANQAVARTEPFRVPRGPRFYAACFVAVLMLSVFSYGLIRFPDAPLHPCAQYGYCGKQGQSHTRAEFDDFHRWETTFFWLWPSGMLTIYLLARTKKT